MAKLVSCTMKVGSALEAVAMDGSGLIGEDSACMAAAAAKTSHLVGKVWSPANKEQPWPQLNLERTSLIYECQTLKCLLGQNCD